MPFPQVSTEILVALLAGAWTAAAAWSTWRARRLAAAAAAVLDENVRDSALLEASPAAPLLIGPDGAIRGHQRLAAALGLREAPGSWTELLECVPFGADDSEALRRSVAEAASGSAFAMVVRPVDSDRIYRIEGGPAPPACRSDSVLVWFSDVSEAERESASLRAQLARRSAALDALSRVIELAPFPIWHRGPDLSLTMVNSAYVAAVEAEDAAAVVSSGIELIEEEGGESPLFASAEARDGRETIHRTVPVTIAGERRMMYIVEVPLGSSGIAGYAIDVEDQEEARAELVRFARAQRDMLDRLSAGVAQFGRERSLIFFNQPFARLFGLQGEFLADRPEFDRVIDAMREAGTLPEVRDFPEWKEAHRDWFISGLVAEEEDWLLPGGKHLRVVAQPLPDGGLLLIFEDRTEQIQLASARDTLLRVRSATFDNLFEAVGVFASDGRLNLWNNRFRELWGFEEDQLAGHPRVDSLTPHLASRLRQPRHASLVRELVRSATQERKQRTGRVAMVDGREFEFAAVPLPDGNALFTMLDITDSRKVEAALRERTDALEEADRLKTAFVSNMSYELRTPLTSIGGFAEMLAGGYAGELGPTAKDYVGAILESVARLGTLIDDVLDLTQSEAGGLSLERKTVDLVRLAKDAAAGVAFQVEDKAIDFAVQLDKSLGKVSGDAKRLRQALDNLLRNAIAFTPGGGRVLLHGSGDEQRARLVVSDNGPGMDDKLLARAFDRFGRGDGPRGDASVGLGLPLARQFVEAHGGKLTLISEAGQGTAVTIELPR
jgi:PAS domain S-box-containing protein